MPFNIEVLSVGENSDNKIAEVGQILNASQEEFKFNLPPEARRQDGAAYLRDEYQTEQIWEYLKDYRANAKGHRPFLIAVVDGKLNSKRYYNLFGSHRASEGLAVITLRNYHQFADSFRSFLSYYLIRYALSFVCPELKSHQQTRDCFFDFKQSKKDLEKSLRSGAFCKSCRQALVKNFNPEIQHAITKLIEAMQSQHAASKATLHAPGLKGFTQIGVVTIREDEFTAVLDRFENRRHASGRNRNYEHVRLRNKVGHNIGVAIGRSPEQGQGPAHAIATDMIHDFAPRWILLVGIAGGFADADYTLGDVLLSSRVHDFAVSAALEGGVEQYQQQGGAVHRDVEKLVTSLPAFTDELGDWSNSLTSRLPKPKEHIPDQPDDHFYGSDETRSKVHEALRRHFPPDRMPRNPIFKVAPMITANTLLKDTKLAEQWRVSARHAAAVEMELGGVYLAARYGGGTDTRVLAIRGISDIVGYKRSPSWTEFACHSAAALAEALITGGLVF
jgi:nucleoside phosphorylase/predicted Zn-dependent protease